MSDEADSSLKRSMARPTAPSKGSILRSVQKDQQYMTWFRNDGHVLLQKILGPRVWIQWRQEINAAADFLYYACTTLNGLQTLGEEYVRIIEIQSNQLKLPSLRRRFLMVTLKTAGPLILESLMRPMPQFSESLELLQRVHVALFYFFGSHYELSKRLTDINYSAIRTWMSGNGSESAYKLLGILTLAQFIIRILLRYWNSVNQPSRPSSPILAVTTVTKEAVDSNKNVDPSEKCSLCLDLRSHSTATPCGHLFCWDCIHGWLENKEECPLCRKKCSPSRLVYLHN